jgi:hypothetical protein
MAAPEDASLPEPGREMNLVALIEGSRGTRHGLLSYPLPSGIAGHPRFAGNTNLMVYATVTLLQIQVADSSPLDGSVPTPVETFYNRSRTPSPHALDDLTRGMVTLPDAARPGAGRAIDDLIHAEEDAIDTSRNIGNQLNPPPFVDATAMGWQHRESTRSWRNEERSELLRHRHRRSAPYSSQNMYMETSQPMPSILIVDSPSASPRLRAPVSPQPCPLAAPSGLNGSDPPLAVPAADLEVEPPPLPRARFRFRVVDSDEDSCSDFRVAPGRRSFMGSHIMHPMDAVSCPPDCSCHRSGLRDKAIRTPVRDLDSPPGEPEVEVASTVSYEDAEEGDLGAPFPENPVEPILTGALPASTPSGAPDMQAHDLAGGPRAHLNPEALNDFWSNIPVHLLDPFPPPDADEWAPGFTWSTVWAQASAAGISCSATHSPGTVCRFCQHSSPTPPFPHAGWRDRPLFGPHGTHAERCAWLGWPVDAPRFGPRSGM